MPGSELAGAEAVAYLRILMDRREIVVANGVAPETFLPGRMAMAYLAHAARQEILMLFPELAVTGHLPMSSRLLTGRKMLRRLLARSEKLPRSRAGCGYECVPIPVD